MIGVRHKRAVHLALSNERRLAERADALGGADSEGTGYIKKRPSDVRRATSGNHECGGWVWDVGPRTSDGWSGRCSPHSFLSSKALNQRQRPARRGS